MNPLASQPDPNAGRPAQATSRPEVARFATSAAPGLYWLRAEIARPVVEEAESCPGADFAVAVVAGWRTGLLFQQDSLGRITLTQILRADGPDQPGVVERVRRVDLAQKFLDHGQLAEAMALLESEWSLDRPDPIAGCLAGSLLIHARRIDDLEALGKAMVANYPTLPDSQMLLGIQRLAVGQDAEAAEFYRATLDLGLPITAPLLKVLASEAARLSLQHPRLDLLNQVARRQMGGGSWTAWDGRTG